MASVFISSTSEDLKEYRLAARDAVLAVGLRPEMMEYFSASGGPPLDECLERVTPCELVVVLAAQRYGWVPPDQPGGQAKSITWLECEHAVNQGKELLVFRVDKDYPWPKDRSEAYRVIQALEDGTDTPELLTEVRRNREKLKEFTRWLEDKRTRATFSTPDDLRAKVLQALHVWLEKHPECKPRRPKKWDATAYLGWVRQQCGTIDIRGLVVGGGKAHGFPIEELYIPLTTAREVGRDAEMDALEGREPMELEEALTHRRLVIIGDPGSGKTTFLRRIAFSWAGSGSVAVSSIGLGRRGFPILIRVAELLEHIGRYQTQGPVGEEEDGPGWISHFLGTQNAALGWGLSREYFEERLATGEAVVLLDGLDEAANQKAREHAARLFENATKQYKECRFVVTTRPGAYAGGAVLDGFHEARIEPLSAEAIDTFLQYWCRGLYPDSEARAGEHRKELSDALRTQPEIRRMAATPVMLTALAVVHYNERRIPEQRADLYDSILWWLSRQREKRDGRDKPERCLTLLEALALAMQRNEGGRLVRVPFEWGGRALAREFGHAAVKDSISKAVEFLERETGDSGIIVNRGGELQFWHLTFQEHLAARAIAGLQEPDQIRLLLDEERIYRPEWRETALLLGGILHKQGKAKVDGLVSAALERCEATLKDQARAVGLLGAVVRDLAPFDYTPADRRYRSALHAVLGIFDREKAKGIEFPIRLEAAEALGEAGDPRIGRDRWVPIKGGTFRMGASGREVTVGDFAIGRYPVTVGEYRGFVESNGYGTANWWSAGGFGRTEGPGSWDEQVRHPNRPVTEVNWFEAKAYCAWAGVRLLTEQEWEWAARSQQGREYPWGSEEPDATRANYSDGGPGQATPVGLYPAGATPEGVLDMAGNVWEWVNEGYDDKQKGRVLRGGSWSDFARDLRSAVRFHYVADYGLDVIGFRVARELPLP